MAKYSEAFIDVHRYFNVDHDWWDSAYCDFESICSILGIELEVRTVKLMNGNTRADPDIEFSGFWSQGDGASWAGRYIPLAGPLYGGREPVPIYDLAPAKIREHAPEDKELHRIADELCMLARIYGPVYAGVSRIVTRSCHSGVMTIDCWEYLDEEIDMDDVASEIQDHIEETLTDLFRDLADWLYKALETEYYHLTSDEAVIEALEANDIEENEEI